MPISSNQPRYAIAYLMYNAHDALKTIPWKAALLNHGDTDQFTHPHGTFQLTVKAVDPLLGPLLYVAPRVFQNSDTIVVNDGVITVNGSILTTYT